MSELYTRSERLACCNAPLEAHAADFMMHYDPFFQKVLTLVNETETQRMDVL